MEARRSFAAGGSDGGRGGGRGGRGGRKRAPPPASDPAPPQDKRSKEGAEASGAKEEEPPAAKDAPAAAASDPAAVADALAVGKSSGPAEENVVAGAEVPWPEEEEEEARLAAAKEAEAPEPKEKASTAANEAAATAEAAALANVAGQMLRLLRMSLPPPRTTGQQKRPWAKLLSQFSQIPHIIIYGKEFFLRDYDSRNLFILRHLEEGGSCELKVTGESGRVTVNGINLSQGAKVPLRGGDEIVCGQTGKHAYIFQHPLRFNEVNKAVPISSAGENNQIVIEPGPGNQSGSRFLDPLVTSAESGWKTFKDGQKQGILGPKDIEVTLDDFPYYLSENTKEILLSSAFVHMKREISKSLPKIPSLDQRILLSGPSGSEVYQETLVKALAKHFDARLLILDSLMLCGTSSKEPLKDFRRDDDAPASSSEADIVAASNKNTLREGDMVEYIGSSWLKATPRAPACGSRGKVMLAFEENKNSKVGVRFDNPITYGNDLGGLCEADRGFFCHAYELRPDSSGEVDSIALGKLMEVISEEIESSNLIVLLKHVEKSFTKCTESHASLRNELPPGVLIIGSHTQAESRKNQSHPGGFNIPRIPSGNQSSGSKLLDTILQNTFGSKPDESRHATESAKHLKNIFPNKIPIELPQDEPQVSILKKQLEHDTENLNSKANVLNIHKFLTSRGIECNNLEELSIKDAVMTSQIVDKGVGFAISHYLQHNKPPQDAKLILPIESLKHGFNMALNAHSKKKISKNTVKDVIAENEFEKQVLWDVVSPNDSGVTFEDIGALDNVKERLKELVMLPLQNPELFSKGQLRKPVKGILLFGPPGTGKTMLAKALATEAGAHFINITMSSATSKWVGDGEKYVKAIFSLASKLSPAVIFVDEVDSFLGKRENKGEHDAMRRIKNEFMVHWDGLRTKEQERIVVLGATNRPFDLDEAVVRRFPCRLMVSLPDASNREKILKVILSKEMVGEDVDVKTVATMTDGYSGSDLKNLCTTAAHCPLREILEKEKQEKSLARAEGKPEPLLYGSKDIRPLRMDDFKFALGQVCASFSADSRTMRELVEWNNQFGPGGSSRNRETPSYFM